MSEWTEDDIRKTIANPDHCLSGVVAEELWINAALRRIREDGDGGKSFLQDLLEHLKPK